MARINSFEFASDATFSDPSTATIDYAPDQLKLGSWTLPLADVAELSTAILELIDQPTSDGVTDTEKTLDTSGLSIQWDGSIVTVGTQNYPGEKARDLTVGINDFILTV